VRLRSQNRGHHWPSSPGWKWMESHGGDDVDASWG
jgi:hypothetical protein